MCLQGGEAQTVPAPALGEPGAQDATPAATAPMEQNAILRTGHVPAQPAGTGRIVTNPVR